MRANFEIMQIGIIIRGLFWTFSLWKGIFRLVPHRSFAKLESGARRQNLSSENFRKFFLRRKLDARTLSSGNFRQLISPTKSTSTSNLFFWSARVFSDLCSDRSSDVDLLGPFFDNLFSGAVLFGCWLWCNLQNDDKLSSI